MTAKEFQTIIIDKESDVLLLDIREADEITSEIADGVQHMPMGKVFTEAAQGNLPKDTRIVVFCRSGMRAAIVVRELKERGYLIEGLEGGLNALQSQ